MATIKFINELFRQNHYEEAYQLAFTDWQQDPNNIWEQRKMGWACVYIMNQDIENNDFESFEQHLNFLLDLNLLNAQNETALFQGLFWKLGSMPMNETQRSTIFNKLEHLCSATGDGYSFMLSKWIKNDNWQDLARFIEWWDLSKFQPKDYQPISFLNKEGKTVRLMSLAEQAHITYAKLLLRDNNTEKIRSFVTTLEQLADNYPHMIYPGYFCGKLLLTLDADDDKVLKRLIPFIRRKSRDFWAWQLLSEAFDNDREKQLACLLRAVSCYNKEQFLVKVRTKLAILYIQKGDYGRAKHHLDTVYQTYTDNQWRLPANIMASLQQPWFQTTTPDKNPDIDFIFISNEIIGEVTKKPSGKTQPTHTQIIEGKVVSNKAQTAFFITDNKQFAFIPPHLAKNINIGDHLRAIVHPSFDKKRGTMGLACISLENFFSEINNGPSEHSLIAHTLENIPTEPYDNDNIDLPF